MPWESGNMDAFIAHLVLMAVPLLLAITLHEASHGYAAKFFGDPTAYLMGRLTLNPAAHIDLFGTIVLPALMMLMQLPALGYAKPVPVDFSRLRPARLGMACVALAGPLANLVLAVFSAWVWRVAPLMASDFYVEPLVKMAQFSVQINVVLLVFNLLPVPPLDGGRIVTALLPADLAVRYASFERWGMLIVFALAASGMLFAFLSPVMTWLLTLLETLVRP